MKSEEELLKEVLDDYFEDNLFLLDENEQRTITDLISDLLRVTDEIRTQAIDLGA